MFGLLLLSGHSLGTLAPRLSAQSPETLAAQFAPQLVFTAGEKFYPTSVDYIINSSTLKQRVSGGPPVTVDPSPTPSTLGLNNDTDLFLNNELVTLDAIAADYAARTQQLGYTSYVHVGTGTSGPVIQYWLFYAFNHGPLNDHQGDIEVVEVFLDVSGNPQRALYSQHFAGENALWSDVETVQSTHPVVYVAQGSHANYFRPYQGRIGIENDIVGSDGLVITPSQLNLVMLGERGSHIPSQGWLDFRGRWGYWGSDLEVAQGKAGPLGPVDNQEGVRWGQPTSYLNQTFFVSTGYLYLAWIAANFLLLFALYAVVRGLWKLRGILRQRSMEGLSVGRFLKGRGGLGVGLVVVSILIMIAALALPWYTISSNSQSGPLADQGRVSLVSIDGLGGVRINFFSGATGEASSGYSHLFSTQIPFFIIFAVGLVLLALDIIGVKSGRKMRGKFIRGAIFALIPFILIAIFVTQLPSLLPWASQLLPGQPVPPEVGQVVQMIASSPISGTTTQTFPVVGSTQVDWGYGIGAYLFTVAAAIRVAAGLVVSGAAELKPQVGREQLRQPPPPPSIPPKASTI